MIPLKFKDKKAATADAFINRFSIGFATGASNLPLAGQLSGRIFGVLLRLPEAILTKAWISIMTLGVIGGGVIGLIIGAWGTRKRIHKRGICSGSGAAPLEDESHHGAIESTTS
jgi:hypothetical protein